MHNRYFLNISFINTQVYVCNYNLFLMRNLLVSLKKNIRGGQGALKISISSIQNRNFHTTKLKSFYNKEEFGQSIQRNNLGRLQMLNQKQYEFYEIQLLKRKRAQKQEVLIQLKRVQKELKRIQTENQTIMLKQQNKSEIDTQNLIKMQLEARQKLEKVRQKHQQERQKDKKGRQKLQKIRQKYQKAKEKIQKARQKRQKVRLKHENEVQNLKKAIQEHEKARQHHQKNLQKLQKVRQMIQSQLEEINLYTKQRQKTKNLLYDIEKKDISVHQQIMNIKQEMAIAEIQIIDQIAEQQFDEDEKKLYENQLKRKDVMCFLNQLQKMKTIMQVNEEKIKNYREINDLQKLQLQKLKNHLKDCLNTLMLNIDKLNQATDKEIKRAEQYRQIKV